MAGLPPLAILASKRAANAARSAGFRTRMLPAWRFKAKGCLVGDAGKQKTILVGTGSMGDEGDGLGQDSQPLP